MKPNQEKQKVNRSIRFGQPSFDSATRSLQGIGAEAPGLYSQMLLPRPTGSLLKETFTKDPVRKWQLGLLLTPRAKSVTFGGFSGNPLDFPTK